MSKRHVYSQTELVEMNLKELETVVNREAERINRQISRIRNKGVQLGEFFTEEEMKRPLRQEKLARTLDIIEAEGGDAKAFLLKQYAAMQETDFTRAGIRQREQEREQYARDIGVEPGDISPKQLSAMRKAMRRATGESGMFYQLIVKAVETGVADSYNYFRTNDELYYQTLTERGRSEFIEQQLAKINEKITETNKQRDVAGVQKKEQLVTLLELRNKAKR